MDEDDFIEIDDYTKEDIPSVLGDSFSATTRGIKSRRAKGK